MRATRAKTTASLDVAGVVNQFESAMDAFKARLGGCVESLQQLPSISNIANLQRSSAVSILLFHRCPSTIVFKIPLFVVDSVQSKVVRFFSHIFKKRQKISLPLLTYGNTSTSIVLIGSMKRIEATLNHRIPNFISRAATVSMFTVACRAFGTTSRATISQRPSGDQFYSPAGTLAFPLGSGVPVVWSAFNNSPFSKCVSSQINKITSHTDTSCIGMIPKAEIISYG